MLWCIAERNIILGLVNSFVVTKLYYGLYNVLHPYRVVPLNIIIIMVMENDRHNRMGWTHNNQRCQIKYLIFSSFVAFIVFDDYG